MRPSVECEHLLLTPMDRHKATHTQEHAQTHKLISHLGKRRDQTHKLSRGIKYMFRTRVAEEIQSQVGQRLFSR